ncbi:MAG: aminoacyl-tRNA hydrolase [Deltaproteobacteria bacterium]|nr:aminoacyl-tRNA hydrolase [Deltaproteobacteria bacterium]
MPNPRGAPEGFTFSIRKRCIHNRWNKGLLDLPRTYMNRSGEAVRAWTDYHGIDTRDVLVIHDDLDLPVGRVKVVKDSGAGGHKGVSSIIHHLSSTQFPRVKVGIGRPRYSETVEDYVLSSFYADEKALVEDVIRVAVEASELWVLEGVQSAMNVINCQNLIQKEEKKRCRD